jgi:hypothetical protein
MVTLPKIREKLHLRDLKKVNLMSLSLLTSPPEDLISLMLISSFKSSLLKM